MICYKDKTWCGSKTKNHTCGREFTEEDAKKAEAWWKGPDYPLALGLFCKEDE